MAVPKKKVGTVVDRTGVRPSLDQQLSQTMRAAVSGMSDVQVRDELCEALAAVEPAYAWIEAVYDDEVVYSVFPPSGGIEYYARAYTLDETKREATVSDQRRLVEPVLTYPDADPADEEDDAAASDAGVTAAKQKKNVFQRVFELCKKKGATDTANKTASAKPPCGCGGGHAPVAAESSNKGESMDKKARVKALIESPHNPFTADDATYLEAATDERLATLEANTAATKALADKAAAPAPAADPDEDDDETTELTEEQFLQRAPASIKSAMTRIQKIDKDHKDGVVKTLLGAQKEYTKEELEAMPIDALERMVRVCKASVPAPDYSGRGVARVAETAETNEAPAPPKLTDRILAARKPQQGAAATK